ncbi:MAG: hypothetical protein NTX81_09215, partial [Candidatus Bathyarchaeota archaeon]|nr:hypothetical protein [Candidatus Bathyarchaeota archaeon]
LNSFSLVQLRIMMILNGGLWTGSMEPSPGATLTVRLPLKDKKALQVSPLCFDTNNARVHCPHASDEFGVARFLRK